MKRSANFFGFFYLALGTIFVLLAIRLHSISGWGLFSIGSVAIAALDFMTAIRYFSSSKKVDKKN